MENKLTLHWWYYLLPPTFLSLITTLFYYPSLRYPFVFDDLPTIMDNYEIKTTTVTNLLFSNPRWISKLLHHLTFIHWQLDPFAFRVIDLIIHLLAGILLFTFVLLICKNVTKQPLLQNHALLLATVVSGLFLLHPAQTQTATYITQIRLEGLVVIFSFLTLIVFALTTYIPKIRLWGYLTCALLMTLAAGTKEIIVVLPLLMILVDWFFLAEGDHKIFFKRLPIHGFLAIILYITYLKLGSPVKPSEAFTLGIRVHNNRGNMLTANADDLITPLSYLCGQFRVVLHYIKIFFLPFGLSFDYGLKLPHSFLSAASFLPFLILSGILSSGIILFLRNKTNLISFCIGWFFIVILPRSSIIPSTELVCDYKTYLASFAPLLLIGIGIISLATYLATYRRELQFVAPLVLLTALGTASMARNTVWGSALSFWGDVIAKTEGHVPARAYNNYAVGLIDIGQQDEAANYYKKAMVTDPTYAEPVINLALHHQLRKEYDKAFALYQLAITMKEVHPETYNNLGLLHLARGDYDRAELAFKTAISVRKFYTKAYLNLGYVYEAKKKPLEAIECFENAVNGDSATLDALYTLGKACYLAGEYHKAIKALEQVERSSFNYKRTHPMLATSFYMTNQPERAIPYFAQIYEANKNDISACYNYAQSLLQSKNYGKALELFTKCRWDERFPHTELHIAKCLHYTGRTDEAKRELAHFIKSTPTPTLKQMGGELMKEIMA